VVGQAIKGRRDAIFVVSKVYPHNAGRRSAIAACERSLERLGIDRLDLYLLHWRGDIPLAETVEAFERLKRDGKVARWGVSNFDVGDLDELRACKAGARARPTRCLPPRRARHREGRAAARRAWPMAVMAYSPFDEGRLLRHPDLVRIARDGQVSPATLALAWLVSHDDVIAIPKAARVEHVDAIRAAADFRLTPDVLAALERAFPAPKRRTRLAMI
jgi:diketogulonate reductase-like aldo/keto reductase